MFSNKIQRFYVILLLALATLIQSNRTVAEHALEHSLEQPQYALEVIEDLVLNDRAREKALQLRVSFPKTGAAYPVILFSHGAWGTKDEYQPLIRFWVKRGYVCIQVNHSDSSALGGRPGMNGFRDWANRPRDLAFIIDSLGKIEKRFPALRNKFDPARIGVGGHSFGAHTAQLLGGLQARGPFRQSGASLQFKDDRITAILLLSPPGSNQLSAAASDWTELTLPMMTITGTRDHSRRVDRDYTWRTEPYQFSPAGDKYLLIIDNADHNLGGITGRRRPDKWRDDARQVQLVQWASVHFWDAYLKDTAAARAYLLAGRPMAASGARARLSYK